MEAVLLRIDRVEREVERLSQRVGEGAIAQACVDEKLSSMLVTLAELKESMARISQLPVKRWETLVSALISALAAMCVGILLGGIT
ncbi:MAG TPA: hypothetical protein VJX95_02385 [Oscillospiraceae bacterium]|nr:hypothetical protein [Oscillospiraceae bacterium]